MVYGITLTPPHGMFAMVAVAFDVCVSRWVASSAAQKRGLP